MTRIEIANKVAGKVKGARVWTANKDEPEQGVIRIYAGKGFAQVEQDGVNVDRVGGHEFGEVKAAVEAIGVKAYRR